MAIQGLYASEKNLWSEEMDQSCSRQDMEWLVDTAASEGWEAGSREHVEAKRNKRTETIHVEARDNLRGTFHIYTWLEFQTPGLIN